MKNMAVFASGEGTNAQKIIEHFSVSPLARVTLVLSNKKEAPVLQKARVAGIPAVSFSRSELYESGEVEQILREHRIDVIILAGFLWMMPAALIRSYSGKILNIHPALLPKFGGKGMYGDHVHRAVIAAGEKESGITIHQVNEHYDEGEIIAQFRCDVTAGEDAASLAKKIHALEHQHYPEVIEKFLEGSR